MVIGRPILLTLEDDDGSPSFLEKALRFIEDHGIKVEGILRQAADVDDVHRRVCEYEQGKTEFSAEEDAHVIADCIKYILRELPSSPVPASCCNALLEAFRTGSNNRLSAMRTAILETFPEPNRRLLHRLLLMMQTVVSNKTVNRMSTSAVAACMSPLLLRPLLAGDCELENTHMDVAGDGSFQLLQAAAAANHAQAIIITLLDEYDNIFGPDGSLSDALFTDSDESGTGTEEATDDDTYDDDDDDYRDDDDHDHDEETDDDYEHSVTETCSESGDHAESDSYDEKPSRSSSFSISPGRADNHIAKQRSPSSSPSSLVPQNHNRQGVDDNLKRINDRSVADVDNFCKSPRNINVDTSSSNESASSRPRLGSQNSSTKFHGTSQVRRTHTPMWGRTSAKKTSDFSLEDEDDEIQRLEAAKIDLQNRIAEEANGNAILQESMERRKKALLERRLALEKDVIRLQEQLQKEKDLRAALEAESNIYQVSSPSGVRGKEIALAEENINNLKQRFDDLGSQLSHQHEHIAALLHDRNIEIQDTSRQRTMLMNNKDHEMKGSSDNDERSNKDDGQRNYSMEGDKHNNEWNNKPSLSNKNQNQPNDASRGGLPKFGWSPNNSLSSEASVPKLTTSTSTSRKSSSKDEGGSTTTSALSKLSNRLNILKERRNQIASELQNLDKSKESSNQPALSPGGKGEAPELPIIHSTDKNHSSVGSFVQNQDDHTHQSSHSSTESDNNKDNNKKSDNRSSNLRSETPSSYSSGKMMLNEGDNKNSNKKSDTKRSSNSNLEAPSSYSPGKRIPNEGDRTEDDNKDSNKKTDKKSSNSKSEGPSSYGSSKGVLNEGDNKDTNENTDNKKSSNSKSDVPSSYGLSKGMLNEGDSKNSNKKADNKDSNKKGFSSKSDTPPLSHSSVKVGSTEGDSNEYNKKAKNRGGNKKGSGSKADAYPSQNVDQGRMPENQSSQHLDRMKSEGQWSKSSDKGRQADGQYSSTSTTLSR